MLRINLLPSTVAQRRLSKRLWVTFGALLIPCVLLPLLYSAKLNADLTKQQQDADTAVAGKAVTDGLRATAASTLAEIKPIQDKVDFVDAVHKYNASLVRIYYTLAQYTDSKVNYFDATYSGSTMTVHAYAPSIAEVGRYLQRMYHNIQVDAGPNAVFSSVTIDKVPGYPEGYLNKYYVGKTLVSVGSPPAGTNLPGSSQSPGQNTNGSGSSGGYPGGSGGSSGGGYPGGSGGSSSGGYPGGSGGGSGGYPGGGSTTSGTGTARFGQAIKDAASAFGEIPTPIDTLIQKQLNPLAVPRQQAEYTQQILQSVRVKRTIQGFDFTVTLTLANPPSPPAVPSGSGGSSGGPASSGGYPGGGYPGGVRTASSAGGG